MVHEWVQKKQPDRRVWHRVARRDLINRPITACGLVINDDEVNVSIERPESECQGCTRSTDEGTGS